MEMATASRGPCLDTDGDGLGTSQVRICDSSSTNGANGCTEVGLTQAQEFGYEANNYPEDCTVLPKETNPIPFYSLVSLLLSLVLIFGYYFRKGF